MKLHRNKRGGGGGSGRVATSQIDGGRGKKKNKYEKEYKSIDFRRIFFAATQRSCRS